VSKILGPSFGNDTKIDLYVDKMEGSIPLIKDY